MENLSPTIISSFNSALTKLTGYARRQFAAELCETFFDSSPRKMERNLTVSREMVALGMNERRTGIQCLDAYVERGTKKKNRFFQN